MLSGTLAAKSIFHNRPQHALLGAVFEVSKDLIIVLIYALTGIVKAVRFELGKFNTAMLSVNFHKK